MTIESKYFRHEGVIKEVAKLVSEDTLGNGAFQNSGSSLGDLMMVGHLGWGRQGGLGLVSDLNTRLNTGLYEFGSASLNAPFSAPGILFVVDRSNVGRLQIASRQLVGDGTQNTLMIRVVGGTGSSVGFSDWFEVWHSGIATVDSNGFLVESSPVVKLFSSQAEINNPNDDIKFVRNGVGDYTIKNTLGFAKEGWYFKTPKDANGNVKVFAEYEDIGGDIHVKTYLPDYSTGPCAAGEPVDIPDGRWIDIRLHEEPVGEEEEDGGSYVEDQESMGD